MNVTYISCLYNIYETETFSEALLKNVQQLLDLNLRLVLYVDDFFFNRIVGSQTEFKLSSNLILIRYPLENLEIYSKIISKKSILNLPSQRNVAKDTCEYMALMNSKMELMKKSLALVNTPYLAWIDAGIFKIFQNRESPKEFLGSLNIMDLREILIPGAYDRNISYQELKTSIYWKYLGGFFISDRYNIEQFYIACLETIDRFLLDKCITWEVNIWANTDYPLIHWYQGDHNNTILNIPSSFVLGRDYYKSAAQKYRFSGDNSKSYEFCQKALEYEKEPFSTVNEDLSIVCYYLDKKEEGRMACERVLASGLNSGVKNQTLSNIVFYVTPIPGEIKELKIDLPDNFFQSSPCVLNGSQNGNRYFANIRAVNYRITENGSYDVKDPNNIVRTKNFLVEYDENFNLLEDGSVKTELLEDGSVKTELLEDGSVKTELLKNKTHELSDDLRCLSPRFPSHILGLEDVRFFFSTEPSLNRTKYFFATCCETMEQFCPRIVFGSCSDDGSIIFLKALQIPGSANNSCEKNWLPFVTEDNEIRFIYNWNPLTIYKIDMTDFSVSLVMKKDVENFQDYEFRGSAPPISYKDGWLMTIHQVEYSTPRKYYHRLVWFDKDFNNRKYSQLFYFEKIGIEYNLSICFSESSLVFGYSVNDGCSKICQVSLETIDKYLEFSEKIRNSYKYTIEEISLDCSSKLKDDCIENQENKNKDNKKTPKKICLAMIVKNESKIIERCMSSCLPILDYISICDTGSTDNTVEIIENFCKKNNIPGKVHHQPWKNFGHNRTLSFTSAREAFPDADYCLLIDADMCLKILPDFDKTVLDAGGYLVAQQGGNLYYFNTRLISTKYDWKCIGYTHEYWSAPCEMKQLYTLEMPDFGDGGAKGDKFERDIKLLKQDLEENPKNERAMFYLGNTLHDISRYRDSIKMYLKRIKAGGWYEEVYYSYYRIARCKIGLNCSWREIEQAYEASLDYVKWSRAEPAYEIGLHYQQEENYTEAYKWLLKASKIPFPKDQSLFISKDVYDFAIWDSLGTVAFYMKEYQFSIDCCIKALKSSFCDNNARTRIKNNMKFSLELNK